MTVVIRVNPDHPEEDVIERAASIIRSGGLVAFPTETVYGLGADAMSERAVRQIFEAKGRPADNPLIVHVADRDMLSSVTGSVSRKTEQLIEAFWPGPLTLVVERKPDLARSVSAGLATVAVRMPDSRIALSLIRRACTPVAAPSANASGRPSPTEAAHVSADLNGRIEMILDGGTTNIGIESTVLDVTVDPPVILRPGWITRERLSHVIEKVDSAISEGQMQRSPGTRHRHYSPRARVILVEHDSPRSIERLCIELLESNRVGLIGHTRVDIADRNFSAVYLADSAEDYARSIYAALRELDRNRVDVIVVEGIGGQAEGAAVMDRLRRAASEIS